VDSTTGADIVYNYGTFDFNDPNFYSKFVRGKLMYFLSQEYYRDFVYTYQMENRGIDEQVLNLSCAGHREVQQFLFRNLQDDNKYYKYDFLYDNCTTRLRDIVEKYQDPAMRAGTIPIAKGMTFRNAIHYYLDQGKMHWSKLGIDLLLGSRIDLKMTNREAMFLPEFLETGLDLTGKEGDSLVAKKEFPVIRKEMVLEDPFLTRPITIFSIIALLIFLLGLSKNRRVSASLRVIDTILFFVIGAFGCLLLFMWIGTDHKQTAANYNIFWAWPIHIVAAFILYSRRPWIDTYLKIHMAVLTLLLLLWIVLPQQLNPAIIPIILLLIYRSWKNLQAHGINKISV
jgi:hypothetical protein